MEDRVAKHRSSQQNVLTTKFFKNAKSPDVKYLSYNAQNGIYSWQMRMLFINKV